jgi:hypothetical protein
MSFTGNAENGMSLHFSYDGHFLGWRLKILNSSTHRKPNEHTIPTQRQQTSHLDGAESHHHPTQQSYP